MLSSCILLNPATKADLQAACVQAEATAQGALAQAAATSLAGWLTLAAGLGAAVAALLGGWFAIRTTRAQIQAEHDGIARQLRAEVEAQATQRTHELKATVYIPAVQALASGLNVVIRLADLSVLAQDAMAGYNERLADLFAVHLVAELETADKFLKALRGLQELHQALLPSRPFRTDGKYQRNERIRWSRRCTTELEKSIPSMVTAVAAMRRELDEPVDEAQYTTLIGNALQAALNRNERLFAEVLATHPANTWTSGISFSIPPAPDWPSDPTGGKVGSQPTLGRTATAAPVSGRSGSLPTGYPGCGSACG